MCMSGTIFKYEFGTPKVARNAFNIGEVWNPVHCHGNKAVKLKMWSTFSSQESYCKESNIFDANWLRYHLIKFG